MAVTTPADAISPVAATPSVPGINNLMPLPIRSYEPKDNKAVCALFVEGMLLYRPSEEEDSFIHHDLTRYVNECVRDDMVNIEKVYMGSGGHFWVVPAVDEISGQEEIAAMVALEGKGSGVGELRRLSVNAKYRRLGLGARLVAHVEQWANANGFTSLQLSTDISMTPALNLYDRLGYTRTHHEMIRENPPFYMVWFQKMLT